MFSYAHVRDMVVIITELDSYTIIECPVCEGEGKVFTGKKSLLEKAFADNKRDEYQTCPTCDGNTKVKIESLPPFTDCGRCGGDGKNNGVCGACDGVGIFGDDELNNY